MLQHILRSDQRQHHFIQHVDHRLLLLLLVLGLFPWAAPVVADGGLTVNSVADAPDWRPGDGRCETAPSNGVCTLRAAIQEANALAGRDNISFNLPGAGVQTIALATALPPITAPVTLDGSTQSGASCAAWSLKLELDGRTLPGPAQGLVLRGGGSTVRGLVLNGFTTPIYLDTLGGNTIQCNAIGNDATSTLNRAKADSADALVGILLTKSAGNLIGGSEPGQGNRIAFPTGIYLDGANANRLQGNRLTGLADNQANGNHGIVLANGASRNRIGGLAHGEANRITNFGGAGVIITSGTGNSVRGNTIYANGGLAVDLADDGVTANDVGDADTGPNKLQNSPLITAVTTSADQHLLVAANDAREPTDIAVPFTIGMWDKTPPVEVPLAKGRNVLRLSRTEPVKGLTIKDFTLTPVK